MAFYFPLFTCPLFPPQLSEFFSLYFFVFLLGSINKNKVRIQIFFARNLNLWLEQFKNFCSNPWNSFWGLRNTFGFFTLYSPLIKGYQKYNKSKLTVHFMWSKFRFFNFDLLNFWYPLRYRGIQNLIGKLSDMVKMGQESLVVAALLASVLASLKVTIYYINRALLKLNR